MANPTVFFHKFPGIDSFVPAKEGEFTFASRHHGDGVHQLWMEEGESGREAGSGTGARIDLPATPGTSRSTTTLPRWPAPEASFEANPGHLAGKPDRLATGISWDHRGLGVTIAGTPVLAPVDGKGLRVCGSAWALSQVWDPAMRFYGQGQKSGPLERTGKAVKFWNSDVAGEFATSALENADTDPMYVSIPWLVMAHRGLWTGILLDNPYMSFMSLNKDPRFFVPVERNNHLILGSTDGAPSLWVFTADNPADLVRKYQLLVGVHARPPLWALGHHQSRWGYDHAGHLDEVARGMVTHEIPNSGLWLDIGYMDAYRVFTWNPDSMDKPAGHLGRLREAYGARIVPILDPGVKEEPGYEVYESGSKAGHWCKTPEGSDCVGYVWPGETVFPDFSLPEVREWWAGYCKNFMESGVDGAWIDMNDPSTGQADGGLMLFQNGNKPHAWFHNRYATAMARATQAGFRAARPGKREFIISRSGYTGHARHAAIWLGDNLSNWNHLKTMIPMCLNLSLSGIPFNGPDAPGFDRSPSPLLAREWYKAQFLFPFLRNHSCFYAPRQEPWVFGSKSLKVIRRYIRLRYRLLPFLAQCFIRHQRQGDPILRPLWYDYPQLMNQLRPGADSLNSGRPLLDASRIDDQFFTGPGLLQAPFVDEHAGSRTVLLPPGRWYDLSNPGWVEGDSLVEVRRDLASSPAWAAEGSVIPAQPEGGWSANPDPWKVDFHIFAAPGQVGAVIFSHVFDDGETTDWESGGEIVLNGKITFENADAGSGSKAAARAVIELSRQGMPDQKIEAGFVFYRKVKEVEIRWVEPGTAPETSREAGLPSGCPGPASAPATFHCRPGRMEWTSTRAHRILRAGMVQG